MDNLSASFWNQDQERGFRNRCLIHPATWNLGINTETTLSMLREMGCEIKKPNILLALRNLVGMAKYRRGASLSEAPKVFDCSSLVCWLYASLGWSLPRYTITQAQLGAPAPLIDLKLGDLLFTRGRKFRTDESAPKGIGHVAIATGQNTIIHAKNHRDGIVEEDAKVAYRDSATFRGVRRLLPPRGWYTVVIPEELEINYSSDLRWKVGSKLKR